MKTIIVGVDFSKGNELAVSSAKSMAKAFSASVYLVNVVETTPIYTMYGMHPEEIPTIADYRDLARTRADEHLERVAMAFRVDCSEAKTRVLEGDATDRLLDFGEEVGADLIVVTTHGHTAIGSVLMGSVASGLVRRAKVPILVVPVPGS